MPRLPPSTLDRWLDEPHAAASTTPHCHGILVFIEGLPYSAADFYLASLWYVRLEPEPLEESTGDPGAPPAEVVVFGASGPAARRGQQRDQQPDPRAVAAPRISSHQGATSCPGSA